MSPGTLSLCAATGAWIRELRPWTHYCTLTFEHRTPPVREFAAGRALREFGRSIARSTREHVWIAWATEPQPCGSPHFHTLIQLPRGCAVAGSLGTVWRRSHSAAGFVQVRRYDAGGGAPEYLAMHAAWDVNVACPRFGDCRRRRSCRIAPGPW